MTCNAILLTGLPRSGTTLTCQLLNALPDAVALVEPMRVNKFAGLPTRAAILDSIDRFAEDQYAMLRSTGQAVTRHVGGAVRDNLFAPDKAADGLRPFQAAHAAIHFGTPRAAGFRLVIKHPAAFTALLPDLAQRFACYAIIRNPLSVLASWNSTRMPVNKGHAPAAERLDAGLAQGLAAIRGRTERQLYLLNWYFGQYRRHLDPGQVLRYEDIVTSGGAALVSILPSAGTLRAPLDNRNRSAVYDWDAIVPVAERLLRAEGHCWHFYTHDEVRALLGSADGA